MLEAQVPGNIRRAEHFVRFLRRFVEYLRVRISIPAVEQQSPTAFLTHLQEAMAIDGALLLDGTIPSTAFVI